MLVPRYASFPSAVRWFEDNGHRTLAVHPFTTEMYRRREVYRTFGFDHFVWDQKMHHRWLLQNNPYISDAAAFEPASHSRSRFEAERAAAGQYYRVNLRRDVSRVEHTQLFGPGRGSAGVHTSYRAGLTQDHGAPGERLEVRGVSHPESGNVGKSFHDVVCRTLGRPNEDPSYGSIGIRGRDCSTC